MTNSSTTSPVAFPALKYLLTATLGTGSATKGAADAVGISLMYCVGMAKASSEKTSKRATRRKRTGAYFGPLGGGYMNFLSWIKVVKGWHRLGGSREGAWARSRGDAFTRFPYSRSSPLEGE